MSPNFISILILNHHFYISCSRYIRWYLCSKYSYTVQFCKSLQPLLSLREPISNVIWLSKFLSQTSPSTYICHLYFRRTQHLCHSHRCFNYHWLINSPLWHWQVLRLDWLSVPWEWMGRFSTTAMSVPGMATLYTFPVVISIWEMKTKNTGVASGVFTKTILSLKFILYSESIVIRRCSMYVMHKS